MFWPVKFTFSLSHCISFFRRCVFISFFLSFSLFVCFFFCTRVELLLKTDSGHHRNVDKGVLLHAGNCKVHRLDNRWSAYPRRFFLIQGFSF